MEYLYVKAILCQHCGAKAPHIRRVIDFRRGALVAITATIGLVALAILYYWA